MWIEIFRSGEHTDSKGAVNSYSTADLDEIVSKYSSQVEKSDSFEAPLVKGHPGSDEPAYGWVEKLQRKGEILLAKLKDVSPELVKEIGDGRFKKVSIALYSDLMLRHIGLLGAMSPAVKGLKNVAFSENEFLELNYDKNISSEFVELINKNDYLNNELNNIIFEKNKINDELNGVKNSLFIEELNGKIKLNEIQNKMILNLFNEINDEEIINNLKVFLNTFSNNIDNTIYDKIKINNNYTEFSNTNKNRLNEHLKLLEYMQHNSGMSYEDAFLLLNGENK